MSELLSCVLARSGEIRSDGTVITVEALEVMRDDLIKRDRCEQTWIEVYAGVSVLRITVKASTVERVQ